MKKNIVLVSAVIVISFALYSVDEKEKPKKEVVPLATQKEVVSLINALIKEHGAFSVKLSHPLLPGKVRSWQQKGIIKFKTSWNTFKKDVGEFATFLHSLLHKNPQTGTYYHVENLQKNAALYKALQEIHAALGTYEPKIAPATFKLDKPSSQALQKLIALYGTILYQRKLLDVIKKFLKAFEVEAKKIRTEEETASKKAGRAKKESFEMPEFAPEYELDMGAEFDFTTPSYQPEPQYDLPMDTDIESDEFIKSFFE